MSVLSALTGLWGQLTLLPRRVVLIGVGLLLVALALWRVVAGIRRRAVAQERARQIAKNQEFLTHANALLREAARRRPRTRSALSDELRAGDF